MPVTSKSSRRVFSHNQLSRGITQKVLTTSPMILVKNSSK